MNTPKTSPSPHEWCLPWGIRISKSIDFGAFSALCISLASLVVSSIVFMQSFIASYKIEVILEPSLVIDFSSNEIPPKLTTRISSFTLPIATANTGDMNHPASVMKLETTMKLNGKVYSYWWDDIITSGSATTEQETIEAKPFTVKPGEVIAHDYIFRLAEINGEVFDFKPTYEDLARHFMQHENLVLKVQYTLSNNDVGSKKCVLSGNDVKRVISGRTPENTGHRKRKMSSYVIKCNTQ